MFQLKTSSPEETYAFGQKLADKIRQGMAFCLEGDLGAGKTLLVQGLANALHVTDEVTSPTFALMNVYEGDYTIYHFDLYRLEVEQELEDIGFYEYSETEDAVIIIEWSDRFPDALPNDYIGLKIDRGTIENERIITISQQGKKNQKYYEELKEFCQF